MKLVISHTPTYPLLTKGRIGGVKEGVEVMRTLKGTLNSPFMKGGKRGITNISL